MSSKGGSNMGFHNVKQLKGARKREEPREQNGSALNAGEV
jgi:hypothetical protein